MKKTKAFIIIGILVLFALIIGSLIKNYVTKPKLPTETSNGNYIITTTENSTINANNEQELVKNNIIIEQNNNVFMSISSIYWNVDIKNLEFNENVLSWEKIYDPNFIYYEIMYVKDDKIFKIHTIDNFIEFTDDNFQAEISIKPIIKNRKTQATTFYVDTILTT